MIPLFVALLAPVARGTCVAATDGRYSLAAYATYTEAQGAVALDIGDLNGDSLDDVVVGVGAWYDSSSVQAFLQQSDGTLAGSPAVPVPGRGGIGSVSLGDLDEDGDLDVVTSTEDGVYTLLNDGTGGLDAPQLVGGSADLAVRLADVDQDGHLDILALTYYSVSATWGDGTGSYAAPVELFRATGWPVAIAATPMGGGTANDLLVAEQNATGLELWSHTSARAFALSADWDLDDGRNGGGMALGDLDGDGLVDVARDSPANTPVNLSLFYQDSTGFAPLTTVATSDLPGDAVIADVDANGLNDILVTHRGGGCIGVYLQDEHGLGAEDLYDIPHDSWGPENYSFGVGELTGDDCMDVAIAIWDAGLVVLPGTGCKDVYKDTDGDQVPDYRDLCPEFYDPSQGDRDGDGTGDLCDPCPNDVDDGTDSDLDGAPDACDGCPQLWDDGTDSDTDGLPDACDGCPNVADEGTDTDNDGLPDACDSCPDVADAGADNDGDTVPDACDECPGWDDSVDTDGNGVPDGCDPADSAPPDSGSDSEPPIRPSPEAPCSCSSAGPAFGPGALFGVVAFAMLRRRSPRPRRR